MRPCARLEIDSQGGAQEVNTDQVRSQGLLDRGAELVERSVQAPRCGGQ